MKTIHFLWRFMRPYKWAYATVVVISIIATILALIEPYVLKIVFDTLQDAVTKKKAFALSSLTYLSFIWITLVLFHRGLNELANYLAISRISMSDKHMYAKSFYDIACKSLRFHRSKKSGNLMERLGRAQSHMYRILDACFSQIVPAVITIAAVLIIMFKENATLALISISTSPILIFVTIKLYPKIDATQEELNKLYEKYYGNTYDAMAAIEVVKSFTGERYEYNKFLKHAIQAQKLENLQNKRWNTIRFAQNVSSNLAHVFVIWYGTILAIRGIFSIGDVVLFVALTGLFFRPFYELSYVYDSFFRGVHSIKKIIEYVETPAEINIKQGALKPKRLKGELEFKNISFSYDSGKSILKNVSFHIEPKQTVALVGPSGVGKSTLVRLMSRFYDVSEGSIAIDGHDITDYELKTLRKNIGVVLQDNILFNDTIVSNLRYGKPDVSFDKVVKSAKAAHAHEFIMKLPKKYQTIVGERGVRLSGGEKQRVAIARALIKDPPILIFDEATASLDSENEKNVQEALWKLIKGRTTLIIAHRLSTIMKADEILVFEKGKIKERGSHHDLLNLEGSLYKKLFELQSGGYLIKEKK